MDTETTKSRSRPIWLKWLIRILLTYLIILGIILAVTIIVMLLTFSLIVVDAFNGARELGNFSEEHLVPISEFLWDLFIWLIPGL